MNIQWKENYSLKNRKDEEPTIYFLWLFLRLRAYQINDDPIAKQMIAIFTDNKVVVGVTTLKKADISNRIDTTPMIV